MTRLDDREALRWLPEDPMSVSDPIDQTAGFPGAVVPAFSVWRLSVEHYHDMVRWGILTEDDPVELLDGWLAAKMPTPHAAR